MGKTSARTGAAKRLQLLHHYALLCPLSYTNIAKRVNFKKPINGPLSSVKLHIDSQYIITETNHAYNVYLKSHSLARTDRPEVARAA